MLSWIFKNCIQINSRTSNSDYSNFPLTRTKFSFPWSKFHWNLPRKLEFPALKLELFFASLQSSSYRVLLYLVATFSRPWGVWKLEESLSRLITRLSLLVLSPFSHPFFKTGQWCLRQRLWVHVIEWTNSEFQKLSLSKQGYRKQNLSFENEF